MVSNRCNFLAVYNVELPNGGGLIHLSTSRGMKAIEQANTELIGKDVLSHTDLTFTKVVPLPDG